MSEARRESSAPTARDIWRYRMYRAVPALLTDGDALKSAGIDVNTVMVAMMTAAMDPDGWESHRDEWEPFLCEMERRLGLGTPWFASPA